MTKRTVTPRLEFIIKVFCILVLIFLNLAIWYNGKDLSCDKCNIDFKASRREKESASNKEYQNFSVNINKLYEGFLEDYCMVEYDKMQGFYLKGGLQNVARFE